MYINRVAKNAGNTDSTIEVSGLLATDIMFVASNSTAVLAGGTLIVGPSAVHSASRSEMWHVHLQNISGTSFNPAATVTVSYLIIS